MKDAKGHGSNPRGGGASSQDVATQHQLKIAKQTLNMPDAMVGVMGGMNKAQAAAIVAAHGTGVDAVGRSAPLPPESENSRELRVFADNNADLHRQSAQPIRDNLGKKMDKGVYDSDKATKLWGYHADRAAVAYGKQFGGNGKQIFSPAVRREAAANWEADERGDIKSGASRSSARDLSGRTRADIQKDYAP